MALNEAIRTQSNLGIVSALLTGTIGLSLYASYFIFSEPITLTQCIGSIVLLLGNATLALFAKSGLTTQQVGSLKMVIYALIAMLCFSIRCIFGKTACT